MNVKDIMEQVYVLLKKNQVSEAEQLMVDGVAKAGEAKDAGGALQLLNELLGFYRETGQTAKSYETAAQALKLAESMGLKDTVP